MKNIVASVLVNRIVLYESCACLNSRKLLFVFCYLNLPHKTRLLDVRVDCAKSIHPSTVLRFVKKKKSLTLVRVEIILEIHLCSRLGSTVQNPKRLLQKLLKSVYFFVFFFYYKANHRVSNRFLFALICTRLVFIRLLLF